MKKSLCVTVRHCEEDNEFNRATLYGLLLMIETNLSKLDEIKTGFDSVSNRW